MLYKFMCLCVPCHLMVPKWLENTVMIPSKKCSETRWRPGVAIIAKHKSIKVPPAILLLQFQKSNKLFHISMALDYTFSQSCLSNLVSYSFSILNCCYYDIYICLSQYFIYTCASLLDCELVKRPYLTHKFCILRAYQNTSRIYRKYSNICSWNNK